MPVETIKPEEFGSFFLNGDFERIYYCTTNDFQALVSFKQFVEMAASFNEGVESYQLESETTFQNLTQYVWLDGRKEKAICVSFDKSMQIHGLYIKPYIQYPESNERYTRNMYSMPVKGEWFVVWGGANEFINYHYAYESQRFAYDLLIVEGGSSYKDTQIRNENFHAFNEEILSPADGKVIRINDGIKDNVPGEMNAAQPAGNYVVIEHGNKEYSMVAHLKKNSIQVKEGETVKEGQYIGNCGNSGNSSEPHVHFQVMDSPDFGNGKSLRIRFKGEYEPIQGDTVSNAPKHKDSSEDKFDKVENALTIGEALLLIPRTIAQFFK